MKQQFKVSFDPFRNMVSENSTKCSIVEVNSREGHAVAEIKTVGNTITEAKVDNFIVGKFIEIYEKGVASGETLGERHEANFERMKRLARHDSIVKQQLTGASLPRDFIERVKAAQLLELKESTEYTIRWKSEAVKSIRSGTPNEDVQMMIELHQWLLDPKNLQELADGFEASVMQNKVLLVDFTNAVESNKYIRNGEVRATLLLRDV
jgi:hypothetical protein